MANTTDLASIFASIVAQFTTMPDGNIYNVFMSLNPELLEPEIADLYIAIRPLQIDVDQRTLTGGSNVDLYLIGQFEAWIHTRLDLDPGIRADTYLEDPNYGLFPVIYNMISAGNMYQTGDGMPAPMRLLSIGPFSRRKAVVEWGMVRTLWHFEFAQTVNIGSIPYAFIA
jgi:hypothetical protein